MSLVSQGIRFLLVRFARTNSPSENLFKASNSTKYYYFCLDVGFEIVSRLDFTSQSFQNGPLRIATEIKLKDFGT